MSGTNESERATAGLRRSAPLLVLALLLLAGWFGWSGYTQWQHQAADAKLAQVRDQALQAVEQALTQERARLDSVLKQEDVVAALGSGDAARVAGVLREHLPGAEDVNVWPADLAEAYTDVAAFGYSRLALLEAGLAATQTQGLAVRDGGQSRLGLAAAASLAGRPAVVYVRLPLSRLTAPFETAPLPDDSYLALRQGSYSIVEKGDVALGAAAESLSRPLGKTGLRVAAAVAEVEAGPLGLGAIPCLVVTVLLLALVPLLLLAAKGRVRMPQRRAATQATDDSPTLSESLQRDAAAAALAQPEEVPVAPRPILAGPSVSPDMFRAYDIRGVVGKELNPAVAELIGHAIGSAMQAQGLRDVVVGRDGRLSGPELSASLIEGLRRAGCHVTDIGLAPTPVVYFAAYHLRVGSCVAVTGSHNPPDYNGFKIVIGGETLAGDAITDLYQRINEGRLHSAVEAGGLTQQDVSEDYIQRIADDVQLDRPLKVVADAGNGVAGEIAPRLLEAIGAEVIPLYCDVDGTFPNHHPDPSEPQNLEDLVQMVQRFDADIGLAFDGDGDRLGVVTREGTMVFPDRLLMLFAADVLQRNPGAMIIYDVKCTGKLSDFVLRHGGSPMMWKTGHSLIKSKMRETDAELAGEMSGHFFFKERWYGFDDGLYAAARLLEILAQRDETPSEVLAELPDSISTPEIKVPVAGSPHELVARFVASVQGVEGSPFEGARIATIDGLRADFSDGWGLIRASNTTPVLVLRFEAENTAALDRIRALFRDQLQALSPETQLTF
ncbi:MAG TPA: phosphomannomutase/phosphoglucomutase [Stenotrophomonas sp.]|jgi:phosphomannomutase/phosphoglucomutase